MNTIHLSRFDYFEPGSVAEASALLAEYGGRARILAGGIDLIPRIRNGSIKAECLINIQNIPGLNEISFREDGLYIGAMARLYDLDISEGLKAGYPILQEAIHQITSVQSKIMGTAIGNICLATPASDVATAMMALGAELMISGTKGERCVRIEDFYTGYRETVLKPDEFVTGAFVTKPAPGAGAAFLNRVRTHADIAKISVAAAVVVRDGICSEARIALGAVAPTVVRAKSAESVLIGQRISESLIKEAAECAVSDGDPITDFRSTAEYRSGMIAVLVGRALEKAARIA